MSSIIAARLQPTAILDHEPVLMLLFAAAMLLVLAALRALDRSDRRR